MSIWVLHTTEKPKYKWFRQKWRWLIAQRIWVNVEQSNHGKGREVAGIQEQLRVELSWVESSTTKALVLPPPCASFYTLTSFSLVKKSFPPSIYQKHVHLIFTPCTSTIEKRLPFSAPHVKKSQGKALIGPAWARCQAYTNELNECHHRTVCLMC